MRKNGGHLALYYDVGPSWSVHQESLPAGGRHVIVSFPAPVLLRPRHWLAVVVDSPLVLLRVGTAGAAWTTYARGSQVQCLLPDVDKIAEGTVMEFELGEPGEEDG